ncbi:membrane protein insertase YidC [Dysgonomonas sp. 520]|uniref:membrane protein insertase YidC n=1 Tax=Dysgonomonas sp. 520 TaxID=2302931 RepID=UPI0013D2FCD5|nr:membrane protein insertase YidC [Dysgonomonas sp. 520]NDW09873.1 membrane protein insertase YidC [Dysgonomonas sp. 520]
MDKNTIVGFLLIIVLVIGFSMYSKKETQEMDKERKEAAQDQAEQANTTENQADFATEQAKAPQDNPVDNFFASQTTAASQVNDTTVVATATDSIAKPEIAPVVTEPKEEIVSIENDKIKVDISTKGGQLVNVQLKGYSDFKGDSLALFGNDGSMSFLLENKSGKTLNTGEANFTPIMDKNGNSLTMRLTAGEGSHLDFVYSLSPESYMIKFDVLAVGMKDILSRETQSTFILDWKYKQKRNEKSIKNEQRYSSIYWKLEGQDVDNLSENSSKKEEINNPVKWVAFKDQFFAAVIISENSFQTSVLDSRIHEKDSTYLKTYEATLYAPVSLENNGVLKTGYSIYAGPLQYNLLKSYDDGIDKKVDQLDLDKLVPLGWTLFRWVNQYFVLPLFSILNSIGLSMGIVILLLTIIVKIIISPLTYKSFMSSAKMRVLRPQIEEINKKYPKQEQAMDRQKATMSLYSKAGVSPMAGCVPMLLQMPILLALFSFFPSAIELRHQSFLWADDLSSYDAIITWSANIPLVSWALGNHLSLFCLLMTVTNIVYTKFNMDATNTGQQQMPGMKWMMYFMPVIFLFVLNDYPSGLSYYYFISTLITILLTLIFRYSIDEEKVLAKLEANKLKPKKKSGFMARLEEAQRLQQQQQRAQQNKGNRKKK